MAAKGQANIINNMERCMSIGPWGSQTEGDLWSYNPDGLLSQIVVRHGHAVDSLKFQSKHSETHQVEISKRFGGPGGDHTTKVTIDAPVEQLESIEVTVDVFDKQIVTSISFHTNVTKYGPFGRNNGNTVSIPIQGGVIVGFHGRAGKYLHSIGIYVKLKPSLSISRDQGHKDINPGHLGDLARDIGPWGDISVGKKWDDGIFWGVRQIVIYFHHSPPRNLRGILFQYEKADGNLVWSSVHGSGEKAGMDPKLIELKAEEELVGIEGYTGKFINDENGSDGVKSLTFYTNKGMYGPYGNANGKHFISCLTGGKKIVGFWGASGTYLNAIGIHALYS